MNEQLKEIIVDYQRLKFKLGTARHLSVESIEGKASICMGVRRSGKSTLMYQIMDRLQRSGVPRENILYLNFFDERLYFLSKQGLSAVLEAYFSLYPYKKNTDKIYCFFDEIQMIADWELFIERTLRMEHCDIYITGSSAQMLSKEIATQMRGRALSWEMFPFSFQEFLDYQKINYAAPFSTQTRLLLQNAFEAYWKCGGFPEVLDLSKHLRIKVLQEYFNSILFRDLIERHNIAHPNAVVDLAHWLIDNIAHLYSVNNLTHYLKSLGHKVHKKIVADYISWFEDAYFFFSISIFDASVSRRKVNPRKMYCIDHAMIKAIGSDILLNSGHLLENIVFIALRRTGLNIFYVKTAKGLEVDFLIQTKNRQKILIQVCESLDSPATQKREINSLIEAMQELNLKEGIIVTRNQEESFEHHNGNIKIVPVWRFLLEIKDIALLMA